MEEFKTLVTEVLTQHATAILLDPEWGLPASKRRAKDAGLLLAYEKTGYDANTPGRLPDLLDVLVGAPAEGSGRRLHQDPALLHAVRFEGTSTTTSTPGSSGSATSAAPTTSRSSSSSSATTKALDEKGARVREEEAGHRHRRMEEFTKDRYGVDVMKVEVPINMKFVEGAKRLGGQKAYSKQEAMDHFRRSADVPRSRSSTCRPASATPSSPRRSSSPAKPGRGSPACCAAARHGRTASRLRQAGRRGVPRRGSRDEGVKNIKNVNDRLKAAHPWFEFYGAKSADALADNWSAKPEPNPE